MQVRPHFTLTRHQPVEAISGRSNNESHGRCSPVLSALHCTDEWLKMRLPFSRLLCKRLQRLQPKF